MLLTDEAQNQSTDTSGISAQIKTSILSVLRSHAFAIQLNIAKPVIYQTPVIFLKLKLQPKHKGYYFWMIMMFLTG